MIMTIDIIYVLGMSKQRLKYAECKSENKHIPFRQKASSVAELKAHNVRNCRNMVVRWKTHVNLTTSARIV